MHKADFIILAFMAIGFGYLVAGVVQTIAADPGTVPALLTGVLIGLLAAVVKRSIQHHFHN